MRHDNCCLARYGRVIQRHDQANDNYVVDGNIFYAVNLDYTKYKYRPQNLNSLYTIKTGEKQYQQLSMKCY